MTNRLWLFQGTVTLFAWKNPHTYVTVQTTDDRGALVEWEIETGATPLLARSGWAAESLVPGDQITVRAHPARDGRLYALLLSLETADGTVLEQRVDNAPAVGSASDLSGIWKGTPLPEDIGDRWFSLPRTQKGLEAQAQFDINTDNPAASCVADNTPATVITSFLYLTEIELGEDVVVMRTERFDAERTIYMDGREHPEGGERTNQGHSIGWWEGDTLVVDTTHFADHRNPYVLGGLPSGAQKHVVERYALSEDGTQLLVDYTLEDPEYLAEPFAASLVWIYRPDLDLLRYDCDPEIARQYISQ